MTVVTTVDDPDRSGRVAALLALLARAGLRRTAASRAVIETLLPSNCLTAAEIHGLLTDRGARVDIATVHRVLRRLTGIGVAAEVPRGSSVSFRLVTPAQHCLVCRTCGRTAPLPDTVANVLLDEVNAAGFVIGPVTVPACCPDCACL